MYIKYSLVKFRAVFENHCQANSEKAATHGASIEKTLELEPFCGSEFSENLRAELNVVVVDELAKKINHAEWETKYVDRRVRELQHLQMEFMNRTEDTLQQILVARNRPENPWNVSSKSTY